MTTHSNGGSKRTGPDLHRVGGKYNDIWHFNHMLNPRSTSPGSIMPSYQWLFQNDLDISTTAAKIRAMQTLGVPYELGYDAIANEDLDKQAEIIVKNLTEQDPQSEIDFSTLKDKEIIAMIAYLQRLGTDIQVSNSSNP